MGVLEKLSRGSEEFSNALRQHREWIDQVAGGRMVTDNRESWRDRAAERCGLSYRTMKSVFYGDIIDPDHEAIVKLKEAAQRDGATYILQRLAAEASKLGAVRERSHQ